MTVRNSKALIGALFLQYSAYAVFYIVDEIKGESQEIYKAFPAVQAEEVKQEEAKAGAPGGGAQQKKGCAKLAANFRDMTYEEQEEHRNWEKKRLNSITNDIVEFFPRQMMFHSILVAFCAIRSPNDTAVIFTYFMMLLRIMQVFGFYCNKKIVYIGAGVFEALLNVILFGITLAYNPEV